MHTINHMAYIMSISIAARHNHAIVFLTDELFFRGPEEGIRRTAFLL